MADHDHDPLCVRYISGDGLPCICDLLDEHAARVRADERERMTLPEWTQVVADARASLRAQIAADIEADHATGPLCCAFGGGANVCTHGRDAAIARGESDG